MARTNRIKSITGIYHVMLKGIDDRNIFLDEMDRNKFKNILLRATTSDLFSLIAYCFMNNHIHLVIKENEPIGKSIQRITVSYSYYHNIKYGRIGHLFNNRYRSKAVESENYLLNLIAYIHQNPIKSGLSTGLEYTWSSHLEYLTLYRTLDSWLNKEIIFKFFPSQTGYLTLVKVVLDDSDFIIDYRKKKRLTDDELYQEINSIKTINEIKELSLSERNLLIKKIKEKTQASQRQLSRVLGIGRGIIERACNK